MRKLIILGIAAIFPIVLAQFPMAQSLPYDLLLRNGRIVDGTGSP